MFAYYTYNIICIAYVYIVIYMLGIYSHFCTHFLLCFCCGEKDKMNRFLLFSKISTKVSFVSFDILLLISSMLRIFRCTTGVWFKIHIIHGKFQSILLYFCVKQIHSEHQKVCRSRKEHATEKTTWCIQIDYFLMCYFSIQTHSFSHTIQSMLNILIFFNNFFFFLLVSSWFSRNFCETRFSFSSYIVVILILITFDTFSRFFFLIFDLKFIELKLCIMYLVANASGSMKMLYKRRKTIKDWERKKEIPVYN